MNTDLLTGLPSRRALCELLRSRTAGVLLYVDIVALRFSNAVLGPNATDSLIVETAALLKAVSAGAFVAKVSGDEFVVVLENLDAALQLAQALRSAFDSQFAKERASIRAGTSEAGVINAPVNVLTLRIGDASLTDHPDVESAIRAAEQALS